MTPKLFSYILITSLLLGTVPAPAANGNAEKTRQLIAVLQSTSADLHAKARACQQAGEFGTPEIIPALAALLDDEQLAAYARSGLENIHDPAAPAALRAALGTLQGNRLIGAINSLGVLRDEQAVPPLCKLATDPTKGVVSQALLALGQISTDESCSAVRSALRSGPAQFRPDAAAACLLAAERQLATGKTGTATAIYDDVRAADLPAPLRAAAVRGAILSRKADALPLLLLQLRSEDPAARAVALRVARELPGPQVTAALIIELSQPKPALQELLIGVLVDRHDPAVLGPIQSLLSSGSPEVRLAAIKALALLGAPSSVPLLLDRITSGDETEAAAAIACLARIKANGTESMILKRLPGIPPALRAQLILVLGDRNATGIIPQLLPLARDPDADVATAAFKTMATVAGPDDVAALLPVTLAIPDGPVRTQAERAVYLTLLRAAADRRVEPILKAFGAATNATDKQTLIRLLGLLGTPPACDAVRRALKDPDETVREAASRALFEWPDASAMPWLLATIEENATPRERTLAFRGAIRIASRELTSPCAVEWFQQLNRSVASTEEKRLIIAGLIQLAAEHAEGLQMLRPYPDDTTVAADAASTIVQCATAMLKGRAKVKEPAMLKALLEHIAAGNGGKSLRAAAAAAAKGIPGPSATLSPAHPAGAALRFTPLFNGRNFDGWQGDTAKSFRIAEDAIVGGNLQTPIPRNEFLATTRRYSNFVLRAECKLVGQANGGIQIRSERIPNHHEVTGYQADMSSAPDGGYWGCLYDESRRKKVLSAPDKTELVNHLKPNDWNRYEIRCEGNRIQLFLNGHKTVDYTEPDAAIPQQGIIAIQIHGGPPSETWYRNLSIAELP